MTAEERVASLHEKMDLFRRARERRKTAALGAASAVLTLCLLVLVFSGGSALRGGSADNYSGTMLFENAGGYTLTAVLAFMAGMAATLFCLRWKARSDQKKEPQERPGETQNEEKLETQKGGN